MLAILLAIILMGSDVQCHEDFSACWTDDAYIRLDNDSLTDARWRFVNIVYQRTTGQVLDASNFNP